MKVSNCVRAAAGAILALTGACAWAGVTVTIVDRNTAVANISLTDAASHTYDATVTITFDNSFHDAYNLTADSLNLTAQLVNPASPPATLPLGIVVDPAFPVLVSVEPPHPPPDVIFTSGLEPGQPTDGSLAFFNTYYFEVHTHDLDCSSATSPYRLFKAPHGSTVFADVTDDILSGSVRARGRGGAFSQFLVVKDTRLPLLVGLTDALGKLTALTLRLTASGIVGPLLTNLTALLANVLTDILTLNLTNAVADLDTFIADVLAGAGTTIANEWVAGGGLSNDAGDLVSLAETLRFTLLSLQGSPLCQPPPP
ncbi:MAG TPA: DUF6689 family protein [Rudaea sp.]